MRLKKIYYLALLSGGTVVLTACGGGDDHHVNASQLAEVDAALVQIQSNKQKDEAALAEAIASGAGPETITALQARLAADQALESTYVFLDIEERERFALGSFEQRANRGLPFPGVDGYSL